MFTCDGCGKEKEDEESRYLPFQDRKICYDCVEFMKTEEECPFCGSEKILVTGDRATVGWRCRECGLNIVQ